VWRSSKFCGDADELRENVEVLGSAGRGEKNLVGGAVEALHPVVPIKNALT